MAHALGGNARFRASFDPAGAARPPTPRIAVLACMDPRVAVERILDLRAGEAHVIRNAGAIATDDAIRSLVISRRRFDSREIMVIAHTRCGMQGPDEDELRRSLVDATGEDAGLAFQSFTDLDASLEAQVDRIRQHPWTRGIPVTGFVYEVDTGILRGAIPR
jgi:carbonic anhydrase